MEDNEKKYYAVKAERDPCKICSCKIFICWHQMQLESYGGQEVILDLEFCARCEACGDARIESFALGLSHSLN